MAKHLSAAIEIEARAERVWDVLTDFAAYPQWNPFIRQVTGTLATGARLAVRITPPGGRGMTFRPTVLAATPDRELRWLGRTLVPGLFDGEHSFRLEPLGADRVRLVQAERFSGLLVPVLGGMLGNTERGSQAMNQGPQGARREASRSTCLMAGLSAASRTVRARRPVFGSSCR